MACHIYSSERTAFALFSVFRTLLFTTHTHTGTHTYVLAMGGKSLRITEMYARRRQHLLSSNGENNTLYISNIYTQTQLGARCVCARATQSIMAWVLMKDTERRGVHRPACLPRICIVCKDIHAVRVFVQFPGGNLCK